MNINIYQPLVLDKMDGMFYVGITTQTHLLVTAEALNFTIMRNQPRSSPIRGRKPQIYMEEMAVVTIASNQLCSHQPQLQLITTAPTTSTISCGKSLAIAVATSCSQTRSNNKTPDLTWKTPKSG